jgi:ADP-heptose:LPS heptosyltransferase
MQVSTMRAVDRGLGRPLCWLLTRLRRLLPEPTPPAPEAVRKVLFVKLSEMGALVLAAPAFAEVQKVFPNAEPWLLCFDESHEAAVELTGLAAERVIPVRTGGIAGSLVGLLSAVRRVRRDRFDVVIDLEYLTRVGAVLSYLSGAPTRTGFHRFEAEGLYCGDLFTHRLHFNAYLHIAQSMVTLVRAAARSPDELPLLKAEAPALDELEFPRFERHDGSDLGSVTTHLHAAGVPEGAEILLVNPNSSDLLPLRRWPQERFVELCRRLRDARPEAWVVLTGAPHEKELGDRIMASLAAGEGGAERCASLIGKTQLRELLTLFTLSKLLISADSGPPHFAVLTDIKGITLFGPETPALYGPVTPRNKALTLGLACSPCIHAWNRRVSPCTANVCMTDMTAAWVADQALTHLES